MNQVNTVALSPGILQGRAAQLQQLVSLIEDLDVFSLLQPQGRRHCTSQRPALSPIFVDGAKSLALLRQLLVDVIRLENWLKVQPIALELDPLFEDL